MKGSKAYQQFIRRVSLLIIVLFTERLNAQVNLIANPSFESNSGIPSNFSEFNKCNSWYVVYNTPDYFSKFSPIVYQTFTCSVNTNNNATGRQTPHTGNYYSGLILKGGTINQQNLVYQFTEYIGDTLLQPLIKDHVYDFTLYYSLAEYSKYLSNNLGVHFSINSFTVGSGSNPYSINWWNTDINSKKLQVQHDTSNFISSDTINWTPLNGCFIADGGEKYLMIGNLRDGTQNKVKYITNNFNYPCPSLGINNEHCYIYLDDVSLYDRGYWSGKAQVKSDTTLCFNSSLVIGNNSKDSAQYVWQPASGLSCTNCPNPIASPSVSTTYTLTKSLCSLVSKDSITLTIYTPTASAKAGNDFTLCLGSNQRLALGIADSTRYSSYKWLPAGLVSCDSCATPFVNSIDLSLGSVGFTLLRTECGITTTATVNMTLEDCQTTYTVPNIYTPNNDDVNEVWGVAFNQIRFIKNFQLNVYNRWGQVIFESNQPNRKWDARTTSGEPLSDGVYFYTLEFLITDKPIRLKGTVTLLR